MSISNRHKGSKGYCRDRAALSRQLPHANLGEFTQTNFQGQIESAWPNNRIEFKGNKATVIGDNGPIASYSYIPIKPQPQPV